MDWGRSLIFKLPKKGDLSKFNNWRSISLLSIASKVFCRFLLKIDRQGQAAFLKDRGYINQNFALQYIICILSSASIVISPCLSTNFIDFKEEFDSGYRQNLWKIRMISLRRFPLKVRAISANIIY